METQSRFIEQVPQSFPSRRGNWAKWLLVAGGMAMLLALGLPWVSSAYYLEQSGRALKKAEATHTGYGPAEKAARQALSWQPQNAQAYHLLAQIYGNQGAVQAAAEVLQRYVELCPKDPAGYWDLALACEQIRGEPCETDPASSPSKQAWLWRQAGQSPASFVRAGEAAIREQAWEQAEAWYERALLLDPETAEAWYGLARVRQEQGNLDQAFELYGRAIGLSADGALTAQAHDHRGSILAQSQRWQEAQHELSRALALAPEQGHYHLDYGWYLYRGGGDWAQAYAALSIAADMLPNNPLPHLRLADLEFAVGHYAEMLGHARQAIDRQPTLFWSWLAQGRALSRLDRIEEAEQSLRKAVELAPDQALVHLELGRVLMQLDRPEAAIEEYEQATTLAPGNVSYLLNLAKAYRLAGRNDQARATLEKALQTEPGNTKARQALEELGE